MADCKCLVPRHERFLVSFATTNALFAATLHHCDAANDELFTILKENTEWRADANGSRTFIHLLNANVLCRRYRNETQDNTKYATHCTPHSQLSLSALPVLPSTLGRRVKNWTSSRRDFRKKRTWKTISWAIITSKIQFTEYQRTRFQPKWCVCAVDIRWEWNENENKRLYRNEIRRNDELCAENKTNFRININLRQTRCVCAAKILKSLERRTVSRFLCVCVWVSIIISFLPYSNSFIPWNNKF